MLNRDWGGPADDLRRIGIGPIGLSLSVCELFAFDLRHTHGASKLRRKIPSWVVAGMITQEPG